jgi:hypothetical protein
MLSQQMEISKSYHQMLEELTKKNGIKRQMMIIEARRYAKKIAWLRVKTDVAYSIRRGATRRPPEPLRSPKKAQIRFKVRGDKMLITGEDGGETELDLRGDRG